MRGDHGAAVGTGIENRRGQRPFALGKPLGDSFDGRREIASLTDGKRAAHGHVHDQHPADKRVQYSKDGPDDERERQPEFGPDFVNEPTHKERHAGVKPREERCQPGEILIGPPEAALCHRNAKNVILQVADDLPVHVVDRRGKKQQRADDPAKIGCGRWWRMFLHFKPLAGQNISSLWAFARGHGHIFISRSGFVHLDSVGNGK